VSRDNDVRKWYVDRGSGVRQGSEESMSGRSAKYKARRDGREVLAPALVVREDKASYPR